MSCDNRGATEAVSPPDINPLRRIGEGEVTGDSNSDSDSRRRSRSPRESRNLRPKGSDDAAPETETEQKKMDEESEIDP